MFLNILIISYFVIINDYTSARWTMETFNISSLPSKTSSSPPPANLKINLTDSEINLSISDQHEYFNLVLFANPFIKSKPVNGCPPLNTSDYNMRLYYMYCQLSTDEKVNNVTFSNIFTGCHYFVMINKENQRWDLVDFHETSYRYLDTRVTLRKGLKTIPEREDSSLQLELIFEIPLDCISIAVELYEITDPTVNADEIINEKRIPTDQSCILKINNANDFVKCLLIGNISATVNTQSYRTKNKWLVHLRWTNLTHRGGHYYLRYLNTDLGDCEKEYNRTNIRTWELMKVVIEVDLEEQHVAEDIQKTTSTPKGSLWLWIGSGLGVFIFIIIIIFGIWMWRRFSFRFCKKNENDDLPALSSKHTRFNDGNKQSNILLIYERGYPSDEELKNFKRHLKQKCMGCNIRDVYAPTEFTYIGDVKKWIDDIFKTESKVIWFDTPQLRSRFNNQEKYRTSNDFRDSAATYAFSLIKAQTRNPTTQYRRHFVLRLNEFEVDDGQDDPLEMVSPYARYRLPDQLPDLCNHLNSSTELIKNNQDLCKKLELDLESNSGTGGRISQQNME